MTSDIQERLRADDLLQQDEEFVLIPLCREAADTIDSLRELLIDWRNCWLCPATDFEGQVERLLAATDAALSDGIVKGE